MDRLEQLRQVIDDIVHRNPDPEERRCGFLHLYGVADACALLALKRGLDPQLCAAAGMLHDIWNYQMEDNLEHAQLGAAEAEKILSALGSFTADEIRTICGAIARHSNKESVDGETAELLKDADVLQHYLYNPLEYEASLTKYEPKNGLKSMRLQRLENVLRELGVTGKPGW